MAEMRTQVSRSSWSLSCLKGLTLCGWRKGSQCGGRGFSCQLDSSTSKQTPCLTLHQLHSPFFQLLMWRKVLEGLWGSWAHRVSRLKFSACSLLVVSGLLPT